MCFENIALCEENDERLFEVPDLILFLSTIDDDFAAFDKYREEEEENDKVDGSARTFTVVWGVNLLEFRRVVRVGWMFLIIFCAMVTGVFFIFDQLRQDSRTIV